MRREIEGLEVELLGVDEPLGALISALGARVTNVR
jgi:erythronate-4-phosphate dehydrogenase